MSRERTLALLDVENMILGGPVGAKTADYVYAVSKVSAVADLTRNTQLVIGIGSENRLAAFAAIEAWPGAALRCRRGRDGGELALLDHASDLGAIARTYDRVVIGSGDQEFVKFVESLNRNDVHCVVVSWHCQLSKQLQMVAPEVRLLDSIQTDVFTLGHVA